MFYIGGNHVSTYVWKVKNKIKTWFKEGEDSVNPFHFIYEKWTSPTFSFWLFRLEENLLKMFNPNPQYALYDYVCKLGMLVLNGK